MITVTVPRLLVASATLLAVAFTAHANPREAKVTPQDTSADLAPVSIETPSGILSPDKLKLDSAPVIEIDDILSIDITGAEMESVLEDVELSADADVTLDDAAWQQDAIDLSVEAPQLDLRPEFEDDFEMPEAAPRIKLDMPAPEITLDF